MNVKQLITNFLLSLVPEFLAAFLIAAFQEYNQIQTFFIVLAIIYGVYFVIWLKRTIWEWVMYSFGGKEQIAEATFNFLKSNDFPNPWVIAENYYEGQNKFAEYLQLVIRSNDVSSDVKLKASAQLGALQALVDVLQYQRRIRFEIGADLGMRNFTDACLKDLQPEKSIVGVKV